jgi:nicotinate-nucleotide adenylyltransferase
MDLDEVWWLVSPQNPLKPSDGMGDFEARLAGAEALAAPHGIRVTDAEMRLGTRYTRDTLRALQRRLPRLGFVWLMGADNLAQLPRWQGWADVMRAVPIAIFARAPYSYRALAGKAASRFAEARVDPGDARDLAWRAPPAWTWFPIPRHPASATAIRRGRAPRQPDAEREGKR